MTNTRVAPPAALADATYTKSTRSTGTGNCVEVATDTHQRSANV